jgi:D-serine deaminase-like pyridoxal phosphate-dependent protein
MNQPRSESTGPAVHQLETPCLVVDSDVLQRNIDRMAEVARDAGVALRPHVKTHKTLTVGHRQIAAGASGITVAKIGEAEVFADAGFTDILIAYQIVGEAKIRRLITLARRVAVLTCVDSIEAAQAVSTEAVREGVVLRLLLDVDTGLHRTGCQPDDAVEIGGMIDALPGVSLTGVFSFAGYPLGDSALQARMAWSRQEAETAVAVAADLRSAGVDAATVSVAGTVCAPHATQVAGVTEIRPGTYAFGDMNYTRLGAQTLDDCALRIRTTVVGRPAEDRAVLDAGTKVLASDKAAAATVQVFGHLPDHPSSLITRAWEEHAVVELAAADRWLRVGDVVEVIPNHACVVTNLADSWHETRDGTVLATHSVAARGRVR